MLYCAAEVSSSEVAIPTTWGACFSCVLQVAGRALT